jgi:phosphate starvation-inducible protein PhoH and related proteins
MKNKRARKFDAVNVIPNQLDATIKKDRSPIIPQRSKLKFDLHLIERPDLTQKQKEFIELALNKNTKLLFVTGPAGSTKSYLSILIGLKLMSQRKISDIIYIRSIVEAADSKIGYLPGEIGDKVNPYMEPLYDKMNELLPKNEIDLLKKDQRITTIPISFLRGLNWNAKYIVADEAQNMTFKELTTLATRVGEYSKIIISGDIEQSDINGKCGLPKFMNVFDDDESKENGIYVFRFTEEDILRSKLVKFIVSKLRKAN